MAQERVRQGAKRDPREPLHLVVVQLDHPHRMNLERLLAHELGHIAHGHYRAADDLSATQIEQREQKDEREADVFAERYGEGW